MTASPDIQDFAMVAGASTGIGHGRYRQERGYVVYVNSNRTSSS